MIKKWDFLWLLAYPIYQIIGTFRHEGSHALVGLMQGAEIKKFVFWPSITEHGFYWGYIRYQGQTDWLFDAAPYLFDLLTFILFFCICMWILIPPRWVWVNLTIIGLVSPFVNSLYNYYGRGNPRNDVYKLLVEIPDLFVHAYFVATLFLYILGMVLVFRYSRTSRQTKIKSIRSQLA